MLPRHLLKKIMHDHSGYVRIMMLISDHTGDDVDVDENQYCCSMLKKVVVIRVCW